MELGTKAYYLNALKHVLMTNLTTSNSQSLSSTQSFYEEQIGNTATINEAQKTLYLRNLQQALDEIRYELVGQSKE